MQNITVKITKGRQLKANLRHGVQGEQGLPGQDGLDGKSAYQTAIENGFIGTEQEWILSLKGEKGDTGEQGIQGVSGIKGEKGDTGEQGIQGLKGVAGDSGVVSVNLPLEYNSETKNIKISEGYSIPSNSKINEWNNKSIFSGNYIDLIGIPSSFIPSSHTQDISTINGLTGELNSKVNASDYNSQINQDVRDTAIPTFQGLNVQGVSSENMIQAWMGINFYTVPDPFAPTLTLIADAAGLLNVGTYSYYVTYITAIGETHHSQVASITTDTDHLKVQVTIPVSDDIRVTGRKIYRTPVGQGDSYEYLIAAINDNTTTTYVDNIPDSSLDHSTSHWWSPNTTSEFITVTGSKALMLDTAATTLGFAAGKNITGSGDITLIGSGAGQNLTTGSYNTFVGTCAGNLTTTASYNTFIGRYAGYNTNMCYNTAIGMNSFYTNSDGYYNTTIGYSAGYSSVSAVGCVFIGSNSGYYETLSNTLMIDNQQRENEADARLKALIYGKFDSSTANQFINVNGTFQALSYKSSDGSAGATGSFTSADGKIVTVKNGLITSII